MGNLKSFGELREFSHYLLQKKGFVLQGLRNNLYHLLFHNPPHVWTQWKGLVSGLGLFAFLQCLYSLILRLGIADKSSSPSHYQWHKAMTIEGVVWLKIRNSLNFATRLRQSCSIWFFIKDYWTFSIEI